MTCIRTLLQLNSLNFLVVRLLMEDKADCGTIPDLLEDLVLQTSLIRAVLPLREVAAAVGTIRRWLDLPS